MTMELNEIKVREKALSIINHKITNYGVDSLIDLTGLAGGFDITQEDISLLETYAGPAIFDEQIQELGRKHLGGEKILPVNRTTSAIVATIIALVKPGTKIVHYLPEKPGHPSIQRTAKLIGAEYIEYSSLDEFTIDDNTSLVVITGTTMDYEIISIQDFEYVIDKAHEKDITVFVDDASGARLRRAVHNQPTAIDLGADLSVTSTDKLMEGPRGGLMTGNTELINQIKLIVNQYGWEAQAPIVAGMIKGLEKYSPERIQTAFKEKDELYDMLITQGVDARKTPTGFMFKQEDIKTELEKRGMMIELPTDLLATIYSMLLLSMYSIITIPAVGMPGASRTIRIDWSSRDSSKLSMDDLIFAVMDTFDHVIEVILEGEIEETLYLED